eukprot:3641454-Amphidinium_carterae.1
MVNTKYKDWQHIRIVWSQKCDISLCLRAVFIQCTTQTKVVEPMQVSNTLEQTGTDSENATPMCQFCEG